MKRRKVSDFVSFIPGVNPTRIEKQYDIKELIYYDQAAFEQDYHYTEGLADENVSETDSDIVTLQKGDVVISNSLQKAAMVGFSNAGKILSLNFTKLEFKSEALDKHYFLYLFNSYRDVQRQKERELQGGTILRIPMKSLNQLVVPIVEIEEQIKIGSAYREVITLKARWNQCGELLECFASQVFEEYLKEN
ncbi:restriction endonuclease subunit S [Streptococcus azizii]|uniref:Restriction endonuclease subunit S n=1 Tax=Streptococcus azizii TaxID=1579424 RepID=A0AB36JRG7_9STRE|nr:MULTISPECIES: restriction endonuclease subunit S [Streptococcus]MBF0775194.1 restriction endonuclease subunit S [Streptococcus sp. 19428wD3_AN2]ONK29473.1 restriction endonuclease subunit S [Streptococcus azizii]ONK29981.1 restriction endonuclease subunit S [Streptococcus azizii]ONK30758.1 restriction endonuclease subunit S [Streptococcus azizii]TFU84723.1 restriction endonuclease subunit S [Streptococcus sp. AN2]